MPSRRKKETDTSDSKNHIKLKVVPDMIQATTNLGRGEIEVPKEIKEIEALIFSRGRLNAQFFRGNKDQYLVPSWVERMLSVNSKGVISLGHSSSFINTNYRNWVAFGGLDGHSEGIVTDHGLVVPLIDGYGLAGGAIIDDKAFYPMKHGKVKQKLGKGYLPIIINDWTIEKSKYRQIVFGHKSDSSEIGVLKLQKKSSNDSNLLLSIRPFNQEGVSLINSIEFRAKDNSVYINKELAFRFLQKPQKIATSNYHLNGDSAINVADLALEISKTIKIDCSVGLATMTFVFDKKISEVELYFRMSKKTLTSPPLQETVENKWLEKLKLGLSLKSGNREVDRLFKASIVNLLLLVDPGTITPGPTEYHRFWCRDAAYLINALDKIGYHGYARDALEQFKIRQQSNGFFYSHEGEFDSNGEGIWALSEHAKLTQDIFWLEKNFETIRKAADWIITTRKLAKKEAIPGKENLVKGLLPPGFSAEHLGPCDYFYWDNFWGVTGLRETVHCARNLQLDEADYYQNEYQQYLLDLFSSTTKLYERYHALPVGPYRKCDSAMIANLCAYHPTKIWDSKNDILRNTAEMIFDRFVHKGGFFHEVAWNCYGTYLTMHLAQVFHELNDHEKVTELITWLVKNRTCSMGWAEGISPQTMQGGMGDSPHGWASADWILLLRNLFCSETSDGSIKLLAGFPPKFLKKGITAQNLKTYYGDISFKGKLAKKTLTLKLKHKLSSKSLKVIAPYSISKVTADKGEAMIVDDKIIEIDNYVKELSIVM